jgi:glutamate transport system substrate-binding protein
VRHSIKIGIKFDQPGLGLNDAGNYTGFDVDLSRTTSPRNSARPPTFVQAPSKQRETSSRPARWSLIFATYSITDARKEKVSFAGPYFIAGQDLLVAADSTITGVEGPRRQEALLGHRLDLGGQRQEGLPRRQLQSSTPTPSVWTVVNGQLDALTTDNTILAGYAAQELTRASSRSSVQDLLGGALRRRPEEG